LCCILSCLRELLALPSPKPLQVELLMGRLTNWPAFPPFAWQRSFNGVVMGAIPHALENGLGFFFDAADGSDYYARKRSELFRQRHPSEYRDVVWANWLSLTGWQCLLSFGH
jgi:hypothetical protein